MASKRPFVEEDFTCPICFSVFNNPVLLLCGYSGCKECIENYWEVKKSKECPLCRKVSVDTPPLNLALRTLCASFLDYKNNLEELCEKHQERLSVFCCDDEQLVCERCRDLDEHKHHTYRPISEVAEENKIFLRSELDVLSSKVEILQRAKYDCDEKTNFIKLQSRVIESHIRKDFKTLRNLLDANERDMIEELQQETEQKLLTMRDKVKMVNRDITILTDTIKDLEQTLDSRDIRILKTFQDTLKSLKYTPHDPEVSPGELINHAKYIGNLIFHFFSSNIESIPYSPVVLDPNTVNGQLQLSDDLTELWNPNMMMEANEQSAIVTLPTNLERFENLPCVLGSEGYSTGTNIWNVNVRDNSFWMVGVAAESVQRKGTFGLPRDIWTIGFKNDTLSVSSPQNSCIQLDGWEKPNIVRVELDMSDGQVTFSNPQRRVVYYTFTHDFREKVYPFFYSECLIPLRILPVK